MPLHSFCVQHMSSRRDALFQLVKAIAARRAEMVEVNDRLLADGIITKEEHAASEATGTHAQHTE